MGSVNTPPYEAAYTDRPGRALLDLIKSKKRKAEAVLAKLETIGDGRQVRLGVKGATLLRLILWWLGCSSDLAGNWFYKYQPDIEEETGLTRWNQETARNALRKFGWYKERPGVGNRREFWVDVDLLAASVVEILNAEAEKKQAEAEEKLRKRRKGFYAVPQPDSQPQAKASDGENPVTEARESRDPETADTSFQNVVNGESRMWDSHIPSIFMQPVTTNSNANSLSASRCPDVAPGQEPRERGPIIFVNFPEEENPASKTVASSEPILCEQEFQSNRQAGASPSEMNSRLTMSLLAPAADATWSDEGREHAAKSRAARLIEIQRRVIGVVSRKDEQAALDLARSSVENGIAEEFLLDTARENIIKLVSKPEQIHAGFSAARYFIGTDLARKLVEESSRRRREEVYARQDAMAQERRGREVEEAARAAEEREIRERVKREQVEARKKELLAFSSGRVVGFTDEEESRALDDLVDRRESFAGNSHPLEGLKERFEWCASNCERVGWSEVKERWITYNIASVRAIKEASAKRFKETRKLKATLAGEPAARSIGGDYLPTGNRVFQAFMSLCELEPDNCKPQDRSDLKEAFGLYMGRRDGRPTDARVGELRSFGDWFRERRNRAPFPLEVVNQMPEFRGAL